MGYGKDCFLGQPYELPLSLAWLRNFSEIIRDCRHCNACESRPGIFCISLADEETKLASRLCQGREAQACLPISAHLSLIIDHTPGSASCWKMLSICSGG